MTGAFGGDGGIRGLRRRVRRSGTRALGAADEPQVSQIGTEGALRGIDGLILDAPWDVEIIHPAKAAHGRLPTPVIFRPEES